MGSTLKLGCPILFALSLATALVLGSCDSDNGDGPLPSPRIGKVEIGSGNNAMGIIGRDFHFDMDVVAGEFLDVVMINMEGTQNDWTFEIVWDEYRGMKTTNVHKHFDIPGDAPAGTYSFTITVTDQNGTQWVAVREIELIDPADLPVSPSLYLWTVETDQGDSQYVNGTLENPEGMELSKDEVLSSMIFIQGVKDDGKLYLLLVKKDAGHLPETVGEIDFSKAIVYDVLEHQDQREVYTFANVIFGENGGYERAVPTLAIGAALDNDSPQPKAIEGAKAWASGAYYLGMVYTNSTHNLSLHHYIEVKVVL